jgi:8-oxo-dGTP diphosphatase
MGSELNKQKPIIKAVSACVWRGDDVLLIKRASAFGLGYWSLPGGKIEPSESTIAAAHRELLEETGVTAELSHTVGDFTVETASVIYVISCFTGPYVDGEAVAGSDAGAALWTHWEAVHHFKLAPNISDAVKLARKLISV